MTPSEKIAVRYAEIYLAAFDRISSGGSRSLVGGGAPQQYMDGRPCSGSNAMVTSLVASLKGYGVPVWMTMNRCNDLGCSVRKGEHGIPIVNYSVVYRKAEGHEIDPSMNDELYRQLSSEEKRNWLRCVYMKVYPEFNIHQTDFAEKYPDQWESLLEHFQVPSQVAGPCEVLDRMVETNGWLCPIETAETVSECKYQINGDKILVPERGRITSLWNYYNGLIHEMAHSTGSELRGDRDLQTRDLKEHAREELVAELASAIAGTALGVETCIQDENMAFLKSWASVISEDPNVIYTAVYTASSVAETITSHLGVKLSNGLDVERLMNGVEAAQEAKRTRDEQRDRRREANRRKHGREWNPVKTDVGKGRRR